MTDRLPPIYFYIPQNKLPAQTWLQSPDNYGKWQISKRSDFLGQYDWTLQTYLHLQSDGFPCKLVGTIPNEGIVFSHRWFLKDSIQPSSKLLLVCMQADGKRHPYAQLHVVQNPCQEIPQRLFTLWESYYVPHWPQSGLIPRSPERGSKFENVVFFGTQSNLATELRDSSWQDKLNVLGLNWQIRTTHEQWVNFSDVDVVLAVRRFDPKSRYDWKPATKLYNAWHAGVPIILGRESAFQAERKSALDYLEATSPDEVISALKRLRDDRLLRQAMVENGRVRAQETNPKQMTAKWRSLIKNKAVPAYERWCGTPEWMQKTFLKSRRYLALKLERFPSRTKKDYLAHTKRAADMRKKGLW